jgi:hypothetical protein
MIDYVICTVIPKVIITCYHTCHTVGLTGIFYFYCSFVLKFVEIGCQVNSIYTDFSEAFDKVHQPMLLYKMSSDVEPSYCQWLGFYFFGEVQRIKKGVLRASSDL